MSGNTTTLADALSLDRTAARQMVAAAGVREKLGQVPARVLKGLLENVWDEVLARVDQTLELPLPGLLGAAWSRYAELGKYCNQEEYPPDEVSVVTLSNHTVSSVHRPHVDLEVTGAVPVRLRLDFEVELSAEVEAAQLTIQAARIRKLVSGTVGYEVKLSCGGKVLKEVQGTFRVTRGFSFGEGIPIRPAIRVEKVVEPAAASAAGD